MKYLELAETYEKLENESGKLKKVEILSDLLKKTPSELLPKVVLLASGKIYPAQSEEKTGIANKMMIKTLSKTTGFQENEIVEKFRKMGDLGTVAESCIKGKEQTSLFKKELTINLVFDNLQKLSQITGKGSQDRKMNLISQLLTSSKPKEAKYIVRTALETMRIGVAQGIIRDAIAQTFEIDKKIVENAWFLNANYGEIIKIAEKDGEGGLKKVSLTLGKPYIMMLGDSIPTLKEGFEKYEEPIVEYKYDGVRTQIHKKGETIRIFTRNLEDVTNQFPDLIDLVKKSVKCEDCIIEGETIGVDQKTKKPIPFQKLSRRVQRKFDIEEMTRKIPIRIFLFDLVYIDGNILLNEPYKTRRKKLEKIINPVKDKVKLSDNITTNNFEKVANFYKKASEEQEGVMIKNLNAKYQPGRRVGQWLKVKPILEPLDLAIIGAEWGTGKRSKWFGSFILGCTKEPQSEEYLACGKLGTGLTDTQFQELTKELKKLITKENGRKVELKPEVVVEVGYEEIQKSPKYESGYALRFPRLLKIRKDRQFPNELKKIENLFKQQFSAT